MLQFVQQYKHRIYLFGISLGMLIGASGISFAHKRGGDYAFYQLFAEKLARGELDLSIKGFHGSDFVTALYYLFSESPTAHLEFQLFAGLLIPIAAYYAAYSLFQSKWHGIMCAGAFACMPYVSFSYITGYTQASNILFFLLTIYGVVHNKWWTGLTWAIAILTKPFAIILLPILWFYSPTKGSFWHKWQHFIIGLSLPALYVLAQYLQIGEVRVGVHGNTDSLVVWDGPVKILRNAAWGVQSLFSIHNYYYADPAITGHWNLLHTTPVLIFLGLLGLLNPRLYYKDNSKVHTALLLAAIMGFALNSVVSMDNFYMQFLNTILILAAIPILIQQPLWIPIAVLTLHYQWFYFYLDFGEAANIQPWFFVVPFMADLLGIGWCLMHLPLIARHVRTTFNLNR